jgi:Arc/MetJ-type ribon-helix-helix transcriptional regulator
VAKSFGVSVSTVRKYCALDGVKTERKTRQNTVAVRLSGEEARALDRAVVDLGYENRSDCLRGLVRMGLGFVELSQADAEGMDELRLQMRRIGTNVNQMARAANRRDLPLMREEWDTLNELRAALPKVRIFLQSVVMEHQRKGVGIFRKYRVNTNGE